MTTVIKAANFNFSNNNLPILQPIVTDGLVAMFRPNDSINGLADLSLNNHTLTKVGNPTLTTVSASGNSNNYYQTSIPETQSLTIMAVVKIVNNPNNGIIFGNYETNAGTSIWYSYNGTAKDSLALQVQLHNKKLDGTFKNNQLHFEIFYPPFNYPWRFVAITIDAKTGIATAYNPLNQKVNTLAADFANRQIGKNFRIFNAQSNTHPGTSELAEVLVFNKALSRQQIMQQYEYSKEFMAKHRGIVI